MFFTSDILAGMIWEYNIDKSSRVTKQKTVHLENKGEDGICACLLTAGTGN